MIYLAVRSTFDILAVYLLQTLVCNFAKATIMIWVRKQTCAVSAVAVKPHVHLLGICTVLQANARGSVPILVFDNIARFEPSHLLTCFHAGVKQGIVGEPSATAIAKIAAQMVQLNLTLRNLSKGSRSLGIGDGRGENEFG